ncbi:uncharacterized protein [Nicotiana sylvestris]|uniref:uncharacterized protein n=1 Tax=Nicotiana sylvestris TaxID=4096 RepID=UPI00388C5763
MHDHGQAITELTTTMNQLAKFQLQQVQSRKQVNAMEEVRMKVNKKRTKGLQVQNRMENYVQEDSGFDQDESYNKQEEEVKYVNTFQGQRNNSQCLNQQQQRPQGNQGNWNSNNQSNWSGGNNQGNWNNNNTQGHWSGGNNQGNWSGNNQGYVTPQPWEA